MNIRPESDDIITRKEDSESARLYKEYKRLAIKTAIISIILIVLTVYFIDELFSFFFPLLRSALT